MTTTRRSPTLLAAIEKTPVVQRLKGVSQAGAPSLFKRTRSVTRYQHSVGVVTLARRLDLPPQRQVIALLHDATHSAFSHTLDYLLKNAGENTHEHYATRLLTDSSLIALLGGDELVAVTEAIKAKPEWLGLLDAVDYTVRDLWRAGLIDSVMADKITRDLTTVDGQICFASAETAWTFTQLMVMANVELYMDDVDLFRHSALAELLDQALQREVITLDDVMTVDDASVLRLLQMDPSLRSRLRDFLTWSPSNLGERRDHGRISSKTRLLDPPVRASPSEILPLSELRPAWWRARSAAQRRSERGVGLLRRT